MGIPCELAQLRLPAAPGARGNSICMSLSFLARWVVAIGSIALALDSARAETSVVDATGATVTVRDDSRIVSIGGAVTETIYALGAGSKIVGTDSSSLFPEAATKLPQVGYSRALATEGILSLNPTLILASQEAGPAPVLSQLRDSGATIVMVPNGSPGVEEAQQKIRLIAEALGLKPAGDQLAEKVAAEAAAVRRPAKKPRVLFIYARGGATLNVAGTGTAANAAIEAAGGINAVTGYAGYKPLTAEAAVTAAPDIILIPSRGLESAGGLEALLQQPGLAQTPAGKMKRVIAMDDLLLLGFGPRTGEAMAALAKQLNDAP